MQNPMVVHCVEQRCAAMEKEISEFSYIVSHDLSAVVRHISQFALLATEAATDDAPGRALYQQHLQNATRRAQTMMDQLLAYSRVQNRPLEMAVHDANMLLECAQLQLGKVMAAAEMRVAPLGKLIVDGDLMITAFRHLLDNAIKFRRPNTACIITVTSQHSDGMFHICIADNGIGLDECHFDHAFRMFCQLHDNDGMGTAGAGLAICRRVAHRHHGEICFIPQQTGACIRLSLPHLTMPHPSLRDSHG